MRAKIQQLLLETLSEGNAHGVNGMARGVVEARVLEHQPHVHDKILDQHVFFGLQIFHHGAEVHRKLDNVEVVRQTQGDGVHRHQERVSARVVHDLGLKHEFQVLELVDLVPGEHGGAFAAAPSEKVRIELSGLV